MDQENKTLFLTIAGLAAGGFLIWQAFGKTKTIAGSGPHGNIFTDGKSLLVYCAANPTGIATLQDPALGSTTDTCANWLAANAPAQPSGNPDTVTMVRAGSGSFLEQLRNDAIGNPGMGQDSGTVAQWNWLVQNRWPQAQILMGYRGGLVSDPTPITARQYVSARNEAGLADPLTTGSALWMGQSETEPYAWE